jgi:hypothetical protein
MAWSDPDESELLVNLQENNTVTFQRAPHVYERINIRRSRPWRQN